MQAAKDRKHQLGIQMPLYDLDENQRSEPLPQEELQQFKAHLEHLRSNVVGQGIVTEIQTAPKLLVGKPENRNNNTVNPAYGQVTSCDIAGPVSGQPINDRFNATPDRQLANSIFNSVPKPFASNFSAKPQLQFSPGDGSELSASSSLNSVQPFGVNSSRGPSLAHQSPANSLVRSSSDEPWPAPPPPLMTGEHKGSFLSSMFDPSTGINNSLNNLSLQGSDI